jgi:hypothetical protein
MDFGDTLDQTLFQINNKRKVYITSQKREGRTFTVECNQHIHHKGGAYVYCLPIHYFLFSRMAYR